VRKDECICDVRGGLDISARLEEIEHVHIKFLCLRSGTEYKALSVKKELIL
jgi:hypothetical protein